MTIAKGDYRLALKDGYGPLDHDSNKALDTILERKGRRTRLPRIFLKFVQPKLRFKPKLVNVFEPLSPILLIAHNHLPAAATDFLQDCAIARATTRRYGPFTAYDMALIEDKFQALIDFPASSFDIIQGFVLYPDRFLPKVHRSVEGPKNMDEINSFRPDKMKAEAVAGRRIVLKSDWPPGLYVFDGRLHVPADWNLRDTGLEATLETSELLLPEG